MSLGLASNFQKTEAKTNVQKALRDRTIKFENIRQKCYEAFFTKKLRNYLASGRNRSNYNGSNGILAERIQEGALVLDKFRTVCRTHSSEPKGFATRTREYVQTRRGCQLDLRGEVA